MILFLKKLFGKSGPGTDTIVPRLKHLNFLAALRDMNIPPDQMAVTQPFQADLLLTYAFDLPHTFQMVSYADLTRLGITPEQIREIATTNLRNTGLEIELRGGDDFTILATGGHLEACSLLLPEIWLDLTRQLGKGLVVSVPTRDVVLITNRDSEPGLSAVRAVAQELHSAEPVHGLSLSLLGWTGSRWEVFSPPPQGA